MTLKASRVTLIAAALMVYLFPTTAVTDRQSGTTDFTHKKAAEAFYQTLVGALNSDNRHAIAGLIRYPLQVRVLGLDSRLVAVRDARAMVGMYPLFFGPRFRCAIEERQLSSNGILSLAKGQVIAQLIGGVFKITRLTVALEAPRRPKVPIAVSSVSQTRQSQFAGRLAHNDADTYLVHASAGQEVEVRLERFPGKSLALRVYGAENNQPITGTRSEYARRWKAVVPQNGKYHIEVKRRLEYCAPEITYLLTIAVR
jgi:hypothetical protein